MLEKELLDLRTEVAGLTVMVAALKSELRVRMAPRKRGAKK